jgi:hypothetical protein
MHGFDRLLARRAFAYTALALVIAIGVTIATDEPYSTIRMRLARWCAFAPGLCAVGSAIALGQARARGELRALEALGVAPLRAGRGPMIASWLLGLVACVLLVTPWADASALFPVLSVPGRWVVDAGALVDPVNGIRVLRDGSLALSAGQAGPGTAFVPSGPAALFVVVPLALLMPPWSSAKMSWLFRLAGALFTFGAVVVLLHAAAATRVGPVWTAFSALPIAAQALLAHARNYAPSRSLSRSRSTLG